MVKFKREVVWCAQEKGNHKPAAIFGVDKRNIQLRQKYKAVIAEREAS
jgi:hypothetical protein